MAEYQARYYASLLTLHLRIHTRLSSNIQKDKKDSGACSLFRWLLHCAHGPLVYLNPVREAWREHQYVAETAADWSGQTFCHDPSNCSTGPRPRCLACRC